MNVYQENGYSNHNDYLKNMASDYGLSLSTVILLAETLGENEDFDGLVIALEDAQALEDL